MSLIPFVKNLDVYVYVQLHFNNSQHDRQYTMEICFSNTRDIDFKKFQGLKSP